MISRLLNASLIRRLPSTFTNNNWLLGMGGLTFGIVVVGGLTRLTESGLSITEWNLIKGMKYPSSPSEWEVEFEKYRQSPEYHKLNHHMTVDEFKNIYFMEWFHRMWGRFIGLAFLGPLAYFWAKGKLAPSLKPKLLTLGGLIGFQVI
ncbi:cytochrome oxidase assembly [Conidiobolus coronatus NRRL 28638]|uniref:Cytochrome oxidase assembly n=1 Tax=Conidiobolus coronatus (strain ATCC 28846 / CBS 209.66 / NRRL 28638) TaxID=796925 RepID=A0A137P3D1_CONC2|nr:cytochrome oxidase assembly [Conidiobolus coronatus NRRL 28638]|eukprot:KXN69530.1 cytochrome oxidase assembly [Conidiobolus coronatus NRRL 28638]